MVTVAFATHRPETLPLTADLMDRHEAILLEEPPAPGFSAMLAGELAIDDYLLPLDIEYPEYSRAACELLRRYHRQGKHIHQVEPFLEILVEIHEHFAIGGKPSEIAADARKSPVYAAEKEATGRLLDYYRTVAERSFAETVEAVKRFAAADAGRFRLRDAMRVEALRSLLRRHGSVYIEAGEIHQFLWSMLRLQIPKDIPLERRFVLEPVYRKFCQRPHLFGPGDLLTLRYIFRPQTSSALDDLLAAQSLVYNKILEKEEMTAPHGEYPHTRNEIETIAAVRRLSLKDCARFYRDFRFAATRTAQRMFSSLLTRRS
jgi:hypothetical protein